MRKNIKVLGAVAVAGLVAASGSAFTAGGLVNGDGASEFVGGSVDQGITGSTVSSIVYDVDEPNNKIVSVALTFDAAALGKTPTITFTGGTVNGTYTCSAVAVTTFLSTCTATTQASNNITSLDINIV